VIDTHAHLDACADTPDVLVERARAAGVHRIVTVGTTIDGCRRALDLAEAYPEVYAALGVHAHEAATPDAERLVELRDLLDHSRAVAVGETGLDYFRDYAPRDRQVALFRAQLELAAELGRPVVIHTRAAAHDTLEALARHEGEVVLHCFSEPELLEPALERSWYVSFAGNVTYPKAAELRLAAARVRADRILAETDSPYLSPQPLRGRSNEPAHVVHTVSTLAEARGEDAGELGRRIAQNAARVFGLP
jgi:TatD DNase family protein